MRARACKLTCGTDCRWPVVKLVRRASCRSVGGVVLLIKLAPRDWHVRAVKNSGTFNEVTLSRHWVTRKTTDGQPLANFRIYTHLNITLRFRDEWTLLRVTLPISIHSWILISGDCRECSFHVTSIYVYSPIILLCINWSLSTLNLLKSLWERNLISFCMTSRILWNFKKVFNVVDFWRKSEKAE